MSKITLYHFTRKLNLQSILSDGLDTGFAPININEGINAVHLTWDKYCHKQQWAEPEKRDIRISVSIDSHDKNLISWSEFMKRFRTDRKFLNILDITGGGQAKKNWYFYLGTIQTRDMVNFFDCNAERSLNADDLKEIPGLPREFFALPASSVLVSHEYAAKN
jgi:hypothetical protein